MEARKETLSALKACRFCLSQDETLTSLYDRTRAPKNSVPLSLKILSCVSIEVFPSDRMPSYICNRCKFFMEISYDYKQLCRQADENILKFVQNGSDLNSVSWPTSLQKVYRVTSKSAPELAIMKTVVESGATVQVTANESDSEEEDDENVYNIKIKDGTDEGPKNARVKVITANKSKAKPKPSPKGFSSVSKLTRHVREHAGDRSYPCKYCNKSFIKSHHYTRHLRIKHRKAIGTSRGPFGETVELRCEQCDDTFGTQDELIYHSAIHATQNLICPLCQEKFADVDAVTAHIKSHVNGTEFMCDLCELVFTSKDKLDNHIANAHEDEMRDEDLEQDESSMEMDAEADEEEDDATINLKEEGDHMLVEIKKAGGFMLPTTQGDEEKMDHTNSEESESEVTFTESPAADTVAAADDVPTTSPPEVSLPALVQAPTVVAQPAPVATEKPESQESKGPPPILRRAEEVKRKVPTPSEPVEKKAVKPETNNTGASDKSLRLLEKELQELKRTNTRTEPAKTPAKPVETLRSRRAQIHTSTPKLRTAAVEEKKTVVTSKSPAPDKKQIERRIVTKENKEPKDTKGNGNGKEDKGNGKEEKEKEKEVKEKEVKEKETKEKEPPKSIVKNGASDKSPEEGIRRSTRPSKIKDYAKMIRDRTQDSDPGEESEELDEEYKETDKSLEVKPKPRRVSAKPSPKPAATATTPATPAAATPATAPRKRGRPRKTQEAAPTPAKLKKDEPEETEKADNEDKEEPTTDNVKDKTATDAPSPETKPATEAKPGPGLLISPTGQTLKKIPIKALPPGVKAMPLPVSARPMPSGEVCEMQIGKKVVKVQKIVMTKAEVEAMAKKGLVEMKDGTMVLKQGIKLPTSDPASLKTLVGDDTSKESAVKKATPSRCDIDEDA